MNEQKIAALYLDDDGFVIAANVAQSPTMDQVIRCITGRHDFAQPSKFAGDALNQASHYLGVYSVSVAELTNVRDYATQIESIREDSVALAICECILAVWAVGWRKKNKNVDPLFKELIGLNYELMSAENLPEGSERDKAIYAAKENIMLFLSRWEERDD